MTDRLGGAARLEIALGDVSFMIGIVNQYMVPGLLFRGTTQRDLVIPCVAALKLEIDVENHAAIIEKTMTYDLA